MKSVKILVIDDNGLNLEIVQKFLNDEGFSDIHIANDGGRALIVACDIKPDIVIVDLFMPRFDGFEFIKKFREIEAFKTTPVIVLTGSQKILDVAKAYECGANDVILKPVNKAELTSKVISHLSEAKSAISNQ